MSGRTPLTDEERAKRSKRLQSLGRSIPLHQLQSMATHELDLRVSQLHTQQALGPDELDDFDDVDGMDEIVFLHKVALDNFRPSDVARSSDNQLSLALPILLRDARFVEPLSQRFESSRGLRRLAFWLYYSQFQVADGFAPVCTSESALEKTLAFWLQFAVHDLYSEGEQHADLALIDPLSNQLDVVRRLTVKKVFTSGHRPALLELDCAYPTGDTVTRRVIFKSDDVRNDMLIQFVLDVIETLWENSWLDKKPLLVKFRTVSLSPAVGFMEFVENSMPLRDWDLTNIGRMSERELADFVDSASASFVACYALGIRDRHMDNFMLKDGHVFFELDFKHCFNVKTRGIDAPRFPVPRHMKLEMEERGVWETFRDRCAELYRVLRRNNSILIQVCVRLFEGLVPEETVRTCLVHALHLDVVNENDACAKLKLSIEAGVYSIRKVLKNALHEVSISRKTAAAAAAAAAVETE